MFVQEVILRADVGLAMLVHTHCFHQGFTDSKAGMYFRLVTVYMLLRIEIPIGAAVTRSCITLAFALRDSLDGHWFKGRAEFRLKTRWLQGYGSRIEGLRSSSTDEVRMDGAAPRCAYE
jgi:hypothetical protein